MNKHFTAFLLIFVCMYTSAAQKLPVRITVDTKSREHVQGMAIDTVARAFYLSFTSSFVKTDYQGNVLASIDSINGHLGAMTFDYARRRVYASLECKDDEIGRSISQHLGAEQYSQENSRFYIAEIDVDKLSGRNTPAALAMNTYEVGEAIRDYKNRYGCSGIDGVTIAPQIGKKNGKPCLYVAYGIYGDISRRDNDHQILLEYKFSSLKPGAKEPKPAAKYFIYTGNTTWGIQNLAYDANTGCIFMAAYSGKKPEFPNFSLFAVPVNQKPENKILRGLENDGKYLSLSLLQQGLLSSVKGVRGWRFGKATTGMCPLGDGRWYFSTPEKHRKWQTATVEMFRWKGGPGENPFEPAEP
ncbi:MAG: hypothetical protein IJ222_01115 [Bacteroidales bacterium]|nr:hypothetical protein [Bacteroidales bacterium]